MSDGDMSTSEPTRQILEGSPPAHGEMVAYILESLRGMIGRGELVPGERLVETELTERFSVSRGSVREALRMLAAEGLVMHAPNRGAEVRRLDLREKRELYQIVTELDVLGAGLAALNRDAAMHAAFQSQIAAIYSDEARSAAEFVKENAAFHNAVFVLAGNAQLLPLSRRLGAPLLLSISGAALAPDVIELSIVEHRQIAEAIADGDEERARTIMRRHVQRSSALAMKRVD